HAQRHPGVSRLERGHDPRKDVDPWCRARPDHERAAPEGAEVGHRLPRAGEGGEEVNGMLLEDPAGLGQHDLPPYPVEQACRELALHLGHVLGEGGLAQVHGLGGCAEAPGPGDGEKDLELPERRLHKPGLIGSIATSYWSLCKEKRTLSGWTC